ncbi:MAG: hypothetical protein JO314_02245 [Acidobacteria bacterium]|nr:hypothetical protein [Acidobacteriota bacterium]
MAFAPSYLMLPAALALTICFSGQSSAQKRGGSMIMHETPKGILHVGRTVSYIMSTGAQSGDMVASFFRTRSSVGRKILAKCKDGDTCEVDGRSDLNKKHNYGGSQDSRQIVFVRWVKKYKK